MTSRKLMARLQGSTEKLKHARAANGGWLSNTGRRTSTITAINLPLSWRCNSVFSLSYAFVNSSPSKRLSAFFNRHPLPVFFVCCGKNARLIFQTLIHYSRKHRHFFPVMIQLFTRQSIGNPVIPQLVSYIGQTFLGLLISLFHRKFEIKNGLFAPARG